MAAPSPGPHTLEELRAALSAGQRQFPGLRLGDLDGVDLQGADLREADLRGRALGDCSLDGTQLEGTRLE
jgi:uncharacterized protein YjbI with pentapeptide repeats